VLTINLPKQSLVGSVQESILFRQARQGARPALGQLLESCRDDLTAIARADLHRDLQAKYDAADLVQDTFMEAQRDFDRFRGECFPELRAWLRRILRNNILNLRRRYGPTGKRSTDREEPLHPAVPTQELTPSRIVMAQEQTDALRRAMERLPDSYLRVIVLRQREQMTFEQIGVALNRSAEAARKLWVRAVELLQAELADPKGDKPRSA
jgi:RNA polymerase sigma-70 factor (ECF subfamily)